MALRTPIELMPRTRIRRDAREVAHILGLVGLDPKVGLGLELSTMLAERIQECRDLFALRGVRTKRPTAILMAARSLAKDESQWSRPESLDIARTRNLLALIAQLTERVLAPEARVPGSAQVRPALHIVAATQAVPDLMVSALRQMRDGAHSPATTAQASNVQWMTPRASSERRAA